MRRITRGLTAVAAALVAGVLVQPSQASTSLEWLHVAHPSGSLAQIADAQGRTVLLRGVNVVGLEDDFYRTPDGRAAGPAPYWPESSSAYANGRCPTNNAKVAAQAPVCEQDYTQLQALGFNVQRLPVSWSRLEPQPGHINQTYIDRIAQVVGWAKSHGVYTLIDMHEDAYSRFTPEQAPTVVPGLVGGTPESANHADGAPPWAVVANDVPAETIDGTAELNGYVESAFTSFWLDVTPPGVQGSLQSHYLAAIGALMRRFKNEPAVVGYEIMNEPLPGFIAPPVIDQAYLYPFYERVVRLMTQTLGDTRHLVFYEPVVIRNLTDVATQVSRPWSTYANLVYAPHVYTHVFTADTFLPAPASTVFGAVYPVGGYDEALTTATLEARLMNSALFVGEYGNGTATDGTQLASETAEFDRAGIGTTLWQWKSNSGDWSMYKNGAPIPSRVRYVSRVYPRAVAGRLRSFSYDPLRRSFVLTATADGTGTTEVYVPSSVRGAVRVVGARHSVLSNADGSRLVLVATSGTDDYVVTVG